MIKEIKFTDKALKQINSLLSKKDEGSFFRIAIKGGGCSGFQYEFSFEKNKNNDDLSFENILIDQTSADLLKGSEVDYVSELIGESFKITNPQTKSSCGCGVSFSL
jgi:iron-sulfur cluster insertion protein